MGRTVQDLTGEVFGDLTVLERVPSSSRGARWLCSCSCGAEKEVQACNLKSGNVRSCGHLMGGHNKLYDTEEEKRQASINRAIIWNKRNPEKRREINKKWREKYPHKNCNKANAYRARKINATCTCCTPEEFEVIYLLAQVGGLQVDHIHPLAAGGAHCTTNLQLLSQSENASKGAKVAGGY